MSSLEFVTHSQAHLHVGEVEEVVHVSTGCIFVIRDKNLRNTKTKYLILCYRNRTHLFGLRKDTGNKYSAYLGPAEHFMSDVVAGFHDSVTVQLEGDDRTCSSKTWKSQSDSNSLLLYDSTAPFTLQQNTGLPPHCHFNTHFGCETAFN